VGAQVREDLAAQSDGSQKRQQIGTAENQFRGVPETGPQDKDKRPF
jgi:hypothetical protein